MNNKRVIERFKTARKEAKRFKPTVITDEELAYWFSLLNEALGARANPPQVSEPRRTDAPVSDSRREFEGYIRQIVDRWRDVPPPPVPPLVLTYQSARGEAESVGQSVADEESAEELLARLLKKVR